MIRKSIEPETKVWNEDYGIGVFKSWSKTYEDTAIVEFEDGIIMRSRKNLTEIESESFNPPI